MKLPKPWLGAISTHHFRIPQQGWRGWIGLLVLLISCLGWWSIMLSHPVVGAENNPPRLLTVTGQGSVAVETSIAVVRLGVLIDGTSAQQVQQQVAQQSGELVQKLKDLRVQALQTTGISLNPRYEYKDGQAKPIGVQGQNSVQFEVPIDQAGQILDQAIAAGATQVESVSFKATESVVKAGRKLALQSAVQDAQTQATDVLSVLNLTIQSVQTIQVDASDSPPIVMRPESVEAYNMVRSDAPTPVIGGDQRISARVTLQINY
ncbi:MAG: SIMPL domain-containing protein [Cyanobacteriota bacterium]|nr:SIMPL domain-containing protein [Cyanobacteriota bacterium]